MEVTGETKRLMEERFGKDSLIALATMDEGRPTVRAVNSYYMDGCFYVITHAHSGKMQQLEKDPAAAIWPRREHRRAFSAGKCGAAGTAEGSFFQLV